MTKRILLCDDESHILRAAEFKFRRAGFEVDCAEDGEDAWQCIQQVAPDILVTDCQMPRLDGISLIARIRAHDQLRDMPVMMLTAKGFETSKVEMAEQLGVVSIMGKPFSPRELLRRVEQAIETSTFRPPQLVSADA